jgi:hypothetical protein
VTTRLEDSAEEARKADIVDRRREQLAEAREKRWVQAAHSSIEDPVVLARAARQVRAALARGMLRAEELTPLPLPDGAKT